MLLRSKRFFGEGVRERLPESGMICVIRGHDIRSAPRLVERVLRKLFVAVTVDIVPRLRIGERELIGI